jgi:hypothetical protein
MNLFCILAMRDGSALFESTAQSWQLANANEGWEVGGMKMREGKGEWRTGLAGWVDLLSFPVVLIPSNSYGREGGGGKADLPVFPVYQGTSGRCRVVVFVFASCPYLCTYSISQTPVK